MDNKDRKKRFNQEVSDLKCNEQFVCKNPNQICTWFGGGIVTVDRQYPCDKCK